MRHVIIGSGAAGAAAARAIRERDEDADIVVLGEERHPPYNRCLLTDYLCDNVSWEQLFSYAEPPLSKLGIDLRLGVTVQGVDAQARSVKVEDGEVPFDRLLVATGRRPTVNETLRPYTEHIHSYYCLDDVIALKEALPRIENVVVYGQGVSTLNLITALTRLGKRVTYIIKGPHVDIPLVDESSELEGTIGGLGAEIVREDRISSVRPQDGGYVVETYQGLELPADVVFAQDTYRPSIRCVRESGVEINKGILVDLEMHTSVEHIYAAGDCVEIYHPAMRNYWINFGWPNAVEQGTIAGANMTGAHEAYGINDTLAFEILGKSFRARWWE